MVAPFRPRPDVEDELVCVCCNCQRERVTDADWRGREAVEGERVTHGICPECTYLLYPELAEQVYPRCAAID